MREFWFWKKYISVHFFHGKASQMTSTIMRYFQKNFYVKNREVSSNTTEYWYCCWLTSYGRVNGIFLSMTGSHQLCYLPVLKQSFFCCWHSVWNCQKKDPLFATAKQLCCKWMVRFIGFINVKRDTRWFFKPMWLLSKRCAWQLPKRLWKKRRPNLTCTQTCNQEEEIELLREIYLKVSYILAFTLHFLLSIIVQIRTKNICFDSMS